MEAASKAAGAVSEDVLEQAAQLLPGLVDQGAGVAAALGGTAVSSAGKQANGALADALSEAERLLDKSEVPSKAAGSIGQVALQSVTTVTQATIGTVTGVGAPAIPPKPPSASSDHGFRSAGEDMSRFQSVAHNEVSFAPTNLWEGVGFGRDEASDGADSEAAKEDDTALREYEEMKINTMYKMRQDIRYTAADASWSCPFLYLTNKQAAHISRSQMPKIREVMGLHRQKMVIRLLPSYYGPMHAHTFPYEFGRFPCRDMGHKLTQQLSENLTLLAKEVLLPLAIKTGALIIGTDSCELSLAFLRVAAPVQRQLGDDCPFKVLFFLRAPQFDLMANLPSTCVANFKRQCTSWSKASAAHRQAATSGYGQDHAFHPHGELVPGDYSVVMFECLSRKRARWCISEEVGNRFQNYFISSLAETHPVIGLQTLGTNEMNFLPTVADHAGQGMPLMLLDSWDRTMLLKDIQRASRQLEEPSEPSDPEKLPEEQAGMTHNDKLMEKLRACKLELERMAKEMQRRGITDRHTTSMIAHVKQIFQASQTTKGSQSQKTMWIWQAIRSKRAEEASLMKAGHTKARGALEGQLAADFQRTPQIETEDPHLFATNMILSQAGKNSAWEAAFLVDKCRKTLDTICAATTWQEFADKLSTRENWLSLRGICFFQYEEVKEFTDLHHWCRLRTLRHETEMGQQVMDIQVREAIEKGEDLEAAKAAFRRLCEGEISKSCEYDRVHKTEKAYLEKRDVWLAVYDLLKDTKNVQSADLGDLTCCEKRLFALASNIDRLPSENSLGSLVLIRRAWTLVDLFMSTATFYKHGAKISYFIGLLAGLCVIVISTIGMLYPEAMPGEEEQYVMLGLALLVSAVNGWTAMIEPTKKWEQLRGGALALQKEIWMFRTRIGDYSTAHGGLSSVGRVGAERQAELAFQAFIHGVQEKVLQSAGLKETDFFSISTATDDVHQEFEGEFDEDEQSSDSDDNENDVEVGKRRPRKARELGRSGGCWVSYLGVYHRHNQYPPPKHARIHGMSRSAGRGDNHHSPATPHEYVRYRVMPAKRFYQGRIPKYACRRRCFQFIILAASVASALLSALKMHKWTAIVASFAGACTAWQEFTGVAKKLERYSTVVASLDDLLMWWQALSSVDQSIVSNVEVLVDRAEGLLGSEHSAWLSDAQRNQKQVGSSGGKDSDGQQEESNDGKHGRQEVRRR